MNDFICSDCGRALGNDVALSWHRQGVHGADRGIPATTIPCERQASPEPYNVGNQTWQGADEDLVGTGRYVLSFLLAGFIGLAIQYGLRKKGWTATWINAVIFVAIVILVASSD